jgi:hypothetical protein
MIEAQARLDADQPRLDAIEKARNDAYVKLRQQHAAAEKAEAARIQQADSWDALEIRQSQGWPKPQKRPIPRIEDGDGSGEDDPANYPTVAVMQAWREHRWNWEDPTRTASRVVIEGYHSLDSHTRGNSVILHSGFGLQGLPKL